MPDNANSKIKVLTVNRKPENIPNPYSPGASDLINREPLLRGVKFRIPNATFVEAWSTNVAVELDEPIETSAIAWPFEGFQSN